MENRPQINYKFTWSCDDDMLSIRIQGIPLFHDLTLNNRISIHSGVINSSKSKHSLPLLKIGVA